MSKRLNEDMSVMTPVQNTDQPDEAAVLSPGARLLQARQAKQLNLRDVAAKTRQSRETLEALEAMDTAHMPAGIVRLQVRNYARFLGLPEDEIASGFAAVQPSAALNDSKSSASGPSISTRAVMFAAGGLVVAATIVGAAILIAQPTAPDATDPLAISARLAPTYANITDVNDLVSETAEEFAIIAKDRAWIEVRGSDGTVFRNREMEPGEAYFPRTGAGWTVTVRDAGAFEWTLGEISAATVGEAGQALYSVSVDGALQSAIDARSAALAEAAPGGSGQRR